MKKALIGIVVLAFIIGSGILYLNSRPKLPMPEYPLEAEFVEAAFENWNPWNVEYTIEEEETEGNWNFYVIYVPEEGRVRTPMLAFIQSAEKDGEYNLNISFARFASEYPLSMEEGKSTLAFVTNLFGGFKNSDALYNKFISDKNKGENIESEEQDLPSGNTHMSEGNYVWECSIDGIDCVIAFEQPNLDNPQQYIRSIIISTDLETFYGKREN